ncbi:hypothetical protein PybrP1_007852 [[Pythium] brassicae (nom. inval.)]|nr:hypothetical protein PybrP1_007852 [[Pythium] brassicae (nom. inval.)]
MSQQQHQRWSGERRESADVRRLAAQLGISSRALHDEEASPTREQQQLARAVAGSAFRGEQLAQLEQTTAAVTSGQHDDESLSAAHDDDDDDDELEESLDQYHLESGELPDSFAFPSDSNSLSASESVSSELSLPRSFGQYDGVRVTTDGEHSSASATRRRSPFSGISHFDDHLMNFPTGPPRHIRGVEPASIAVLAPRITRDAQPGSDAASQGSAVMKKFYEVQVEKIRSQLVLATQAQRQLEKTLQDDRAAWSNKLADAERESANEKRRLEQDNAAATTELLSIKKRLELEKSHFANEGDLSIREFIQLTVHRKVTKLETDLEAARKELEELHRVCSRYKASASTASDEVAQVRRVADAKQLRLQHEIELANATRGEMERQIASLCTQINAMKEEQRKNEAFSSSRAVLQSELDQLKAQLSDKESANNQLHLRVENLMTQHEELEQRAALLSADKSFLLEARAHLEEHEALLLKKQRELEAKVSDLQAKHEDGVAQSIHVQNETRLHFEKKMDDEIGRFMELSKQELERIRNSSQVVYERENRLLKEARDDALKQLELVQAKLDQTQCALEEKTLEITRVGSSHMTSLASVRNDLKMKHFEMNQLKLSLEEQMSNCRAGRLEVEMLEQKIQVHREEFAKLEATSTTRITQLEAALDIERNKLKEYEQLEVDLDDAVLQTGAILSDDRPGNNPVGDENSAVNLNDAMTTFSAIPSSHKRRQSVSLAQRLVKFQRESLELQQKLKVAAFEHGQLERKVRHLTTQLAHLHQPQSYLIEKLNGKDLELQQARQASSQLQLQLQELREEHTVVVDAKMALQKQLQQVLARRSDLDMLKSSVHMLREKLQTKTLETATQRRSGASTMDAAHLQHTRSQAPTAASLLALNGKTSPASTALSPFVKVSPPPSVVSKMTEAPPTAYHHQQQPGHAVTLDKKQSNLGVSPQEMSVSTTNTPKWYTKLRVQS